MEEEWVQVLPFLKGKIVACGAKNKHSKACRPLHRVSSKTPLTVSECIDLHGIETIKKLAKQKNRDMEGRLYWKRGVFYPS